MYFIGEQRKSIVDIIFNSDLSTNICFILILDPVF